MDSRKYNSQDITSKLDEIKEAIEAGGLAPSVIADAYSDEETYSVGDYVTYDSKSYRCTTAVAEAEEFNPEKWEEVKVLDELASAVELPPVTSTDNGKILSVVEGEWSKTDETKELPAVTSTDNGKVLLVSGGSWNKGDCPKELPSTSSSDDGKVLQRARTGVEFGVTPYLLFNVSSSDLSFAIESNTCTKILNSRCDIILHKATDKRYIFKPVLGDQGKPQQQLNTSINYECIYRSETSTTYITFTINLNSSSGTTVTPTIKTVDDPESTELHLFCATGTTNLRVKKLNGSSGNEKYSNILARYTNGNFPMTLSLAEEDDPDQVFLNCYAESVAFTNKIDGGLCFFGVTGYGDGNPYTYVDTVCYTIAKDPNSTDAIVYASQVTIGESS